MDDDRRVTCPTCEAGYWSEFEYQPARPERKFLWFRRAGHEARIKLVCGICGTIRYEKPGTLKVTSYVTHNRITGRTSRLY